MAKVLGIGGVFFKSKDPKALSAWYRDKLGMDVQSWGGVVFENEAKGSQTVWNAFSADTKYFEPSDKPYMLNLRVDDLAALLSQLRAAGANVLDRSSDDDNGKFGYVVDPDGNLLELWEPRSGA
jgi:catechol 2,3-dioxygenase-like lactoylglutathione lyase family enzyme